MSAARPSAEASSSSASNPRICKKLVVKGHATSSGASYTLFLKLQLPASDRSQEHVLIVDPNVELQEATIHRLDASGAAPALSASAATAANSLGIPLSIDNHMDDSFVSFESPAKGKSARSFGLNGSSDLPSVVRLDNGRVVLRTKRDPNPQHTSTSYMVTLNLFTRPSTKPPFAPFSLRLAVSFCLNSFMRFTVDESISQDLNLTEIVVEVDPPILPFSSRRRSTRRSSAGSIRRVASVASLSDDEADITLLGSASANTSDSGQDDSAIVGPFHACDALVVRLASQDSGDLVIGPPRQVLSNALRAREATSSITYSPHASQNDQAPASSALSAQQIDFEALVELRSPFFSGLDREVLLYLLLDPECPAIQWQPTSVDASMGILSWSFGSANSPSTSPSGHPSSERKSFEISDLVVLPEPSQQAADDEDLLNEAPPKGINDADFDLSLDNVVDPVTKQRRLSMQTFPSNKTPSRPPSDPSDKSSSHNDLLCVAFNLLPLLQSEVPVVINISGKIILSEAAASLDPLKLPRGFFVPGALSHGYSRKPVIATTPQETTLDRRNMGRLQPAAQPIESLEASRETVRHSQQNTAPASPVQIGDAKTEEILRQALAIISAHNASLTDISQAGMAGSKELSHPRRAIHGEAHSPWRYSHLVWTLFLTAFVVMLFNANQSANRALSARVDELSRIFERNSLVGLQNMTSVLDPTLTSTSSAAQVVPTASNLEAQHSRGEVDLDDFIDGPPDDEQAFSDGKVVDLAPEQDNLLSDTADVATAYTHWLRDLLRMPFTILQQLFSIFQRN